MKSKIIGNIGEKIAERYLKRKGYQILEKNYSFRSSNSPSKGEIDIIAKKENIINFIEVKTLTSDRIIRPEEKVDYLKQKKLKKTALTWLIKKKISLESPWQIDVIAINLINNKAKVRHFKNAVF